MTNMTEQNSPRRITIVGAGITGLSAAYTLAQLTPTANQPLAITLIESENRLGGKIVTDKEGELIIEGGPDCFLRQKPWATSLCQQLGIANEIIGTNDHLRKVYVLDKGRLKNLPDGVMLIVPTRFMPFITSSLISFPGKIRMGLDLVIPKISSDDDESVGSFVRRRLGNEALEKIAEPLMSGIHVSDPEIQSLLATFPRFRNIEKKYGSLIKGMLAERTASMKHMKPQNDTVPNTLFLSLRDGMESLIKTLETSLNTIEIIRGNPVTKMEPLEDGGYSLEMKDGTRVETEILILSIPSNQAAPLLAPLDASLATELNRIRYVSTATISLAFKKSDIQKPFSGFGFVIPRKENRDISACTWTSIKFSHRSSQDILLIRCFIGGPGKEEQIDFSDERIYRIARKELRDILSLSAEPVFQRIYRWPKANPQYDVGHLKLVERIFGLASKHPGLFLTGSSYEGVGIPDCINQGQKTAHRVFEMLTGETQKQ